VPSQQSPLASRLCCMHALRLDQIQNGGGGLKVRAGLQGVPDVVPRTCSGNAHRQAINTPASKDFSPFRLRKNGPDEQFQGLQRILWVDARTPNQERQRSRAHEWIGRKLRGQSTDVQVWKSMCYGVRWEAFAIIYQCMRSTVIW
jgi:hypothetical protein